MTSSINNIIRSFYKIGFSCISDAEILDKCYEKSRNASIYLAKSQYLQEDLFLQALSDAQETEFILFKETEKREIEKTYTFAGIFFANLGGLFIEKEKRNKPELQYQLKRLWMVLDNSRSDKQIRDFDSEDNLSAIIEIYNRDIVKNEASRLYNFYKKNFDELEDPYLLTNYGIEEQKQEGKKKYEQLKKFPDLWSPSEKFAKKQAKEQLSKDINAGVIVSLAAIAITAATINYAIKHFAKKS